MTKLFTVVAVKNGPDARDFWRCCLVGADGRKWDANRAPSEWRKTSWAVGTVIEVPATPGGNPDFSGMAGEYKEIDRTRLFKVVSVSKFANAFGLHGHILMNRTGYAFEVGRSHGAWLGEPWSKGAEVAVPTDWQDNPQWHLLGCEIPRALPQAPPHVVKEVWGE